MTNTTYTQAAAAANELVNMIRMNITRDIAQAKNTDVRTIEIAAKMQYMTLVSCGVSANVANAIIELALDI